MSVGLCLLCVYVCVNVYFSQVTVNGSRERHVSVKQAVITRNSITIKNSMVSKVGCINAKRATQGIQLRKAGRKQTNKKTRQE